MTSDDKLTRIQNQIERLKKRKQRIKKQREKLNGQIALFFYKDIQKIFGEDFCPTFVVGLLADIQTLSPQIHKHECEKHGVSPPIDLALV